MILSNYIIGFKRKAITPNSSEAVLNRMKNVYRSIGELEKEREEKRDDHNQIQFFYL